MMTDRTPDAGFGEWADRSVIKNGDPLAGQVVKEGDLIAEVLLRSGSRSGHEGGVGAISLVQIVEPLGAGPLSAGVHILLAQNSNGR
jgi:hypothetical protein